MTLPIPIMLQYRSKESVNHLGGIAVYFNAVQNWFEQSNIDSKLKDSLQMGNNVSRSSLGLTGDFLFRASLFIANKIDKLLPTSIGMHLQKKKAKILRTAILNSRKNHEELIYHHMSNFVLPDFNLYFLSKKYKIIFLATIVDFLDVDFPHLLPIEIVNVRHIIREFIFDVSSMMLPIADFIQEDSIALGASRDKMKVIKWGTDHFSHSAHFSMVQENPEELHYFVFPAKSWKHKGHLEFLEVYLKSPVCNYNLILMGDTSNIDSKIRKILSKYPKKKQNVKVLGFVPDQEKALIFGRSSGILLPSMYEGFGFPYFEAIRMGKPLFCFKTKAYIEYFDECDNPGAAEVQDYEDLHNRLVKFRHHEFEKSLYKMQEIVKEATWEISCKSLGDVYLSLIRDSGKI